MWRFLREVAGVAMPNLREGNDRMNETAYRSILRRLGAEVPTTKIEDATPLLAMLLDVFAREGQPLELRVPWWPTTLFLVPDVRHAEGLRREGIGRERVWTSGEVASLLTTAPTIGQLRVLTIAKREFGGEVVGVRRGGEGTV